MPVLEPWVLGGALEERLERGVLVAQRLLKRHRGHLAEERKLLGFLPLGQCGVGVLVRGRFLLGGVPALPVGEGLVPHHAHAAERAAQQRRLFGVRVGPGLVRGPHLLMTTEGSDMSNAIPACRERRGILARSR